MFPMSLRAKAFATGRSLPRSPRRRCAGSASTATRSPSPASPRWWAWRRRPDRVPRHEVRDTSRRRSRNFESAALAGATMAKAPIDHDLIRDLARLLDETGLNEIEIEQEGLRVRVGRQAPMVHASASAFHVPPPPAVAPAPA